MAFNFSCGIQRAVKSGQDIYILAARVANDLVILLAHGASHIIKPDIALNTQAVSICAKLFNQLIYFLDIFTSK